LLIPVLNRLDAGQSDILALKKVYTLHVHTAGCGNGYTLHVHRQVLKVLFLLYDIEKSNVNAGMPE
jgi:hypothetical protein